MDRTSLSFFKAVVSFLDMDLENVPANDTQTVVDRRSSILGAPNEFVIGQNCNHRDIARFKSSTDRNFRPVVSRLQKFKRDLESDGQSTSLAEVSVQVSALEGTFPKYKEFSLLNLEF